MKTAEKIALQLWILNRLTEKMAEGKNRCRSWSLAEKKSGLVESVAWYAFSDELQPPLEEGAYPSTERAFEHARNFIMGMVSEGLLAWDKDTNSVAISYAGSAFLRDATEKVSIFGRFKKWTSKVFAS